MPPLLDACVTIAPEVASHSPAAHRFPATFYNLNRPVGNSEPEGWPATPLRSRSMRVLIQIGNTAERMVRTRL